MHTGRLRLSWARAAQKVYHGPPTGHRQLVSHNLLVAATIASSDPLSIGGAICGTAWRSSRGINGARRIAESPEPAAKPITSVLIPSMDQATESPVCGVACRGVGLSPLRCLCNLSNIPTHIHTLRSQSLYDTTLSCACHLRAPPGPVARPRLDSRSRRSADRWGRAATGDGLFCYYSRLLPRANYSDTVLLQATADETGGRTSLRTTATAASVFVFDLSFLRPSLSYSFPLPSSFRPRLPRLVSEQ